MIPMVLEVECELSLSDRNILHESFHLEAPRSLLVLLAMRVYAPKVFVNRVKEPVVPNASGKGVPSLSHALS